MSTNRSVQAAQRRRAGPPEPQTQMSRGPTTSINSAQMFANQARPGNGPNIPNGRIAGQQAAYSQQQMIQQQKQQQEKDPNFSKLTVAQAITLITLRLGAVETKLMEIEHNGISNIEGSDGNVVQIDRNILSTIMNRLEALEKRNPQQSTVSGSNSDVGLIKQQVEAIKPAVVQSKNAIVNLMKTNENLRADIDNLRSELVDIRGTMENVQMLTSEHDKSINSLLFGTSDVVEDQVSTDDHVEHNLDYTSLTAEFDLGINTEDLKNISFEEEEINDEE